MEPPNEELILEACQRAAVFVTLALVKLNRISFIGEIVIKGTSIAEPFIGTVSDGIQPIMFEASFGSDLYVQVRARVSRIGGRWKSASAEILLPDGNDPDTLNCIKCACLFYEDGRVDVWFV